MKTVKIKNIHRHIKEIEQLPQNTILTIKTNKVSWEEKDATTKKPSKKKS